MNIRSQGRHVEDFRPADAQPNRAEFRRILLPYIILIASQIPLSLVYLKVLWTERPHYALLPISILAAALFIALRWPKKDGHLFFPSAKSDLMLLTGVAMGVIGTLLLSPWIGFASMLLLLGSLLARTNDRHVFGTLLPTIAPLVALLQPPVALDFDTSYGDIQLISSANTMATEVASDILDLSKYPHNISGSQMEFQSGILDSTMLANGALSIFTLLIVTSLFIAWQRITIFRGLLLLLAACFWSMAFQALILVVCAIAETSFEKDYYNPGTANRLLQLVGMFGAGIMTLLSDRLITFFCGPVDIQAIDENISYQDLLCRFWNSAIAGVATNTIDVNVKKEVAWAKRRSSNPSAATSSLLWGAGTLLGALCVFQIIGLGVAFAKSGSTVFANGPITLNESSMPASIGEWTRGAYESRVPTIPNAHDAFDHHWMFTHPDGLKCLVEISQPYPCWHDDELELRRIDWKPFAKSEVRETTVGEQTLRYRTGMHRDTLANYRFAFNYQVDGYGETYETPLMWKAPGNFIGRAFARLGSRTRPRVMSNECLELNVFLDKVGPSSIEEQETAEQLFIQLIKQIQLSVAEGTIDQGSANSSSSDSTDADTNE